MNDEELATAVRESIAGVQSATSVEQIVSRGRAMRIRRRISSLAGALAVAAVALAVAALVPSGRPVSRRPAARLAAWTVVKQAAGTVFVIVREFRAPAGLQHELRADGLPASVLFYPGKLQGHAQFRKLFHVKHNPCQEFSGGQGQLQTVVPAQPRQLRDRSTIAIIHPSALPSGAGVQFIATSNEGYPQNYGTHMVGVWLVQASQQCTGS